MMLNNGVLSNLISNTCEVGDPSFSPLDSRSNNINDNSNNIIVSGTRSSVCLQQSNQPFASATQGLAPPAPKKRGHPGNPDPNAEVIALSPKSLLATNRFICEICNKGFRRDQNLQLHRRGHNLPWKLKQRTDKEVVTKKVYVCPEPTCIHHEPSRALGDLTGIKKHFCRKHGEKKWKCERCKKHYAVQADWKAHSKICGTREYKCDCGTVFSRRDSFITHRAFCDALAQASSSSSMLSKKNLLNNFPAYQLATSSHDSLQPHGFSIKKEQEHLHHHHLFNNSRHELLLSTSTLDPSLIHQANPNPVLAQPTATASTSTHMSATALLQRAAQMGVTVSKPTPPFLANMVMPHQQISSHSLHPMPETAYSAAPSAGPVLSTGGEDHLAVGAGGPFSFLMGLDPFGTNESADASVTTGDDPLVSAVTGGEVRLLPSGIDQGAKKAEVSPTPCSHLLNHHQITMAMNPRNVVSSPEAGLLVPYLNSSFSREALISRIIHMNSLEDGHNGDLQERAVDQHALIRGSSDQGTTRDFLGLRAVSSVQEDLVDVAGFDLMNSSSSSVKNKSSSNGQQNKNQYHSL